MSVACVLSQESYHALHDVYNAFNGDYWIRINKSQAWTFPSPLSDPCQIPWQGVACVNASGQCEVQTLELYWMNLTGTLPSQMTSLSHLEQLNLSFNSIYGTLPESWSTFQSLKELSVNVNSISQSLPSTWSTLSNLRLLELVDNRITRSLPESWSSLKLLESLRLSVNLLTGKLPIMWSTMTNIRDLRIEDNSLTGRLPSSWNAMTHMYSFRVSRNYITGSLPDEWSSLRNMSFLSLLTNSLTGNLPSTWSTMSNLVGFGCVRNSLDGSFPVQWSTMTSLEVFVAFSNHFQGPLPEAWSTMTNMLQVTVGTNHLSGPLPTSWSSMKDMRSMTWYVNQMTGTLPSAWSQWSKVDTIALNDNQHIGTLPDAWSTFSALLWLATYGNSLTGTLPSSWSTMTTAKIMYIQQSQYSGTIPSSWSTMKYLELFVVNENQLSGTLPETWSKNTALQVMYFGFNSFSGTLPPSWSTMTNLTLLKIQDNQFEGVIPTIWCAWELMQVFLASNNLFSGAPNLCGSKLSDFDVSANHLTSVNLPLMPLNSLSYFNISHNSIDQSFSYFANVILWCSISSVDVSNNLLTDSLKVFDKQSLVNGTNASNTCNGYTLEAIDVSNNCMSTDIDSSICELTNLTSLLASNMYSGQRCGDTWWRSLSVLAHPYPSCILTLPKLQTISLIGNGLTGTLVDIDPLSSHLSFVGLVSNRLTGTLPESWQRYGRFDQLLLSFNKLSGVFQSDFAVRENMTNLNMSINRFSGTLPASFGTLHQMDVIEGNIINCASQNIYTKGNDANAVTYECGSLVLDVVGVVAAVCVVLLAFCIVVTFQHIRSDLDKLCSTVIMHVKSNAVVTIIMFVSAICMLIVLICLSTANLSSDYVFEYGWVTTTAYLHGWYCVFILILVIVSSLALLFFVGIANSSGSINRASFANTLQKTTKLGNTRVSYTRNLVLLGCHMINITVIGGLTTLFVLIVLSHSAQDGQVAFAILLGIIKVMWGEYFIPTVYHSIILRDVLTKDEHSNSFLRSTKMLSLYPDVLLHEMIADLWCFVLCPLIVILVISATCYRYFLSGMPEVLFSYQVFSSSWRAQSVIYVDFVLTTIKPVFSLQVISSSITPPWFYSYECSSAIVTSYVAVVYYTYIMYTLIWPAVRFAVYKLNISFFGTNIMYTIMENRDSSEINDINVIKDRISYLSIQVTSAKHRTHIRHYVMFMIFGLSSPLLGLLIILAIIMEDSLYIWEVCKLRDAIMSSFRMTEVTANSLCEGLLLHDVSNVYNRYLPWVSLISVGYWSLYTFDTIGDVYGEYWGTVSSVIFLSINAFLLVFVYLIVRHWQYSMEQKPINRIVETTGNNISQGVSMISLTNIPTRNTSHNLSH